jgi:hypothetical protein
MLDRLNKLSGGGEQQNEPNDPRWDKLKNIK